jgi:CheY-like chemotaxis protein
MSWEFIEACRGATVDLAADGELATPGADRTDRPKLLIVDDDPEVRVVVAEFLESFGYSVVQANGGREALDLLPRHPDLRMIISDIRMPDMSGIELVDIATRRQRDLKVIMISGYFVSQQVGRRLLSKPFRMRELEAAVRAELDT